MSFQRQKINKRNRWVLVLPFLILAGCAAFFSACDEIQRPKAEPFYAESTPPGKQEFRWSNGKAPKSFDPVRAAAAPETDIVRALFEGLTEIDARTLKEIPAAADKWTSSDDLRVWTFHLRPNAKWSNGKRVTADDFVTSWKRLAKLGDKAAHHELFQNIVGLQLSKGTSQSMSSGPADRTHPPISNGQSQPHELSNSASSMASTQAAPAANSEMTLRIENKAKALGKPAPAKFGVEAVDDTTLVVSLERADKDFAKLVAQPIFRPIYGDGAEFETDPLDSDVVTNGAFTVASVGVDGIALDRSETYWNRGAVSLEHVRFVPLGSAELALEAYRKGEIDAVTNAEFEPLALKLLAPYDDFRQTAHSAINLYEFNTSNRPFDDHRVREALAISIDRDRLAYGDLEGAAQPALSFLPLGDKTNAKLYFDVDRARQLLDAAGFPKGVGFPKIRLLINRNDTQQRIARAVAKMWKQNLNLDTEISVKDLSEMETAWNGGEYDLERRGVVIATVDEAAGMATIFGPPQETDPAPPVLSRSPVTLDGHDGKSPEHAQIEKGPDQPKSDETGEVVYGKNGAVEQDAVSDIRAIPLYFPMSYSLVKPYVKGFEINGLDATTLKDMSIDSTWQAENAR